MADKTLPPIAIGDSLAVGMREANNLPGIGRVGAGPKEVYEMLQRFATSESLSGRDVFIGTGMPNIPEQKKFIEQQIDFVRKQGGNPILIGVGPGTKSKPTTGQNEFLASLAESKGLPYMGPLVNMFPDVTKDPMGLHLRAPQYKQLFKQYSKSQAQPQPQPKAQPQQVQPQSRESSAADLLSQFTGAILQAESRGRRYDKSGKLLTSPKGAQGEMQVMPGTITDPGFGVKPAKDNSPEEIARVGRDYAAVMLRRYNNNPTLAAVAYNWGPGNADRWIKGGADVNKLPAETRNYVVRIAERMGAPVSVPTIAQPSPAPNKRADVRPVPPAKRVEKTQVPRAEAPVESAPLGSTLDTAPRPAEQQQNVVTRADMERLGPSYQAALAATTLADSRDDEDDYDDEDTIAERYMERRSEQLAQDDSTLEEESTGTSSLADLDLTYQSPFAPEPGTEQPVRLAEGGDPAQEKDMDYKEYVREQLRKETLYAGLGNGDRGSAKRELALFEINKDPRIALMLAGSAGELIRDPVTGAVMGRGVPAVMGRLGIDKNGARAGVSGAAVRLPDGSVKVFPGSADVGYSTPLYKGNLDVSADYALGNLPRPMYGGRIRYEQSFKDGGVVYRADGSPIYGEGIDLSNSGGITEDTRKALATRHSFSPREALSMLGQIGREGVSNLESTLRGSVAAIPGFVGDIESGFRDDKSRKYMTTEEVKRDVLPSRMTAPTAETAGYEELGTYLPLPVTPKQILPPSVVRNLITKARNALPAKEVDTFPMGKLSAEEVLQQVKSFDPKALAKAREEFLASSAEKRRMYHGTLLAPEGKTVMDKRLPDFYKTVGTDQGFTSFKPGTGGMTFVTPNPEFTDLFTGMRFAGKGSASPSRVYPVYVQVKKPFDFENAKHVDELAAEVSAAVRKNKGKKDLAWWMTSGGKPVSTDSVRQLLSTGQWGFIEDPIVLEAAKKLGFDGMYMLEAGTKNLGIFDPKKIKSATGNEGSFNVRNPDIRKAEGGIVHRAEGSPVYGEVADTGPITADTRAAFRNMRMPDVRDAREALKVLKGIAREGVSNLESVARGSVAAVPGIVGDIESFFRDDKKRKFATSEEVERQYLPKRFTAPTKESQGFVEIGTAIDPSIALKAAPKTAKATLKALKESGPQVEEVLMKAAPAAQPLGVVSESRKMLMEVPESSLFVSKVDDFIASQKGPVTKQQLLGQMKGKFRDYEIGRVSAALANYPDTAKFTPEYLLAAVQSSYPTSKLKTYVLEPQKVDRWSSTDNVYFDQPVGVVNLRFDTPMEKVYKSLSNQEALDRLAWITSPIRFATADKKAQDIADLAGAIRGLPDSNKFNALLGDMDRLYTAKNKTDTMLAEIDNAYSAYKYPATKDGWSTAINEYYAKNKGPSMFEDAKKYANEVVQKEADKTLKSYGIDIPSKSLPIEEFMGRLETVVANQMHLVSQKEKDAVAELTQKFYPELTEAAKAFRSNSLYEGQHKSLTPKGTPIAFSRFVDHTVNLPDKGETKVMHMIELQSDLLDDIRKTGSKSGSKVQDLEDLLKTEASIKKILKEDPRLVDPARKLDHIRSIYPNSAPVEKSEAYRSIIKENPEIEKELIEYLKLRDKESKLNVRSRQGKYDLEEAFPGMEMSPQVVQQMMIKNAIGGAMQRGVTAVTFPGKESKQAQLYEKLYPNLKQVVKDLGPGFDLRQIELYDSLGNAYSHWGVVWDDSIAKKVMKQGIRFNKGGLVDKQDSDYRKFI